MVGNFDIQHILTIELVMELEVERILGTRWVIKHGYPNPQDMKERSVQDYYSVHECTG